MVRPYVRHPVNDEERRSKGVVGHAVFQSVDDPNDLTIWHDFESRETAEAFASSERLKSVMQAAGVAGAPTIWFVTEA